MSDFLINAIVIGAVYLFSLLGISYAANKSKKIRIAVIAAVTVAFSFYVAAAAIIGTKRIPTNVVEKEWKRYTEYCKENHISWGEYTFPEWLEVETSR